MTLRASFLALTFALVVLTGCDAVTGGDSDDVTGTWTGQVTFIADTLLTEPAVRIAYDMEQTVELRLIHEDGLVRGTVSRSGSGTIVFRNTSGERDSSEVADTGVISHDVFGTYLDGRLALQVKPRWRDHPFCGTETVPYDSGLFTFGVDGSRGQSDAYIGFVDQGIGSDDEPFTVTIRSDERLAVDRDDAEVPSLAVVMSDPAEAGLACGFNGDGLRLSRPDAPAIQITR